MKALGKILFSFVVFVLIVFAMVVLGLLFVSFLFWDFGVFVGLFTFTFVRICIAFGGFLTLMFLFSNEGKELMKDDF
jgi:hypothetical protein